MFHIKDRKYPLVNSIYEVSEFNELINDTFDGGGRLFINHLERHAYFDVNAENNECYSLVLLLHSLKFKRISYDYICSEDVSLYYEPEVVQSKSDYANEDIVKYDFFVDLQKELILIGDINAEGICYQFFKDTFCVFNNGNIKLLFIKVNRQILNRIAIC